MEKHQEIYIKRKAGHLQSLLDMKNPGNMTDEQLNLQKITGCHSICEDLYLVGLNDNPNITAAVTQLFDTDQKFIKDIQSLYEDIKKLTDKRLSLINGFVKSLNKLVRDTSTDEPLPEFNIESEKQENVSEDIDKVLEKRETSK